MPVVDQYQSSSRDDRPLGETFDALSAEAGLNADQLRHDLAEAERLLAADRGASRAALLTQIDALAHGGSRALMILSGVGFSLMTVLFFLPHLKMEALLWGGLYTLSLLSPITLLRRYHRGGALLKRPFTWRARYTASLATLGFCFGAGALLMATKAALLLPYLLMAFGLLSTALFAAFLQRAHRSAAAAIFLSAALPILASPGLLFYNAAPFFSWPLLAVWSVAWLLTGCLAALLWQSARVHAATTLHYYPRRETRHITAGQKPVHTGYNPYRLKMLQKRSEDTAGDEGPVNP